MGKAMKPVFIQLGNIILNAGYISHMTRTKNGIKIVTTLPKDSGKPFDFYVAGEEAERVLQALESLIVIKVDLKSSAK
jgi:hypothetical protein